MQSLDKIRNLILWTVVITTVPGMAVATYFGNIFWFAVYGTLMMLGLIFLFDSKQRNQKEKVKITSKDVSGI